MFYDQTMTTTSEGPSTASELVAEVLRIQSAPTCAERRAIREGHRISISRLARAVGVTPPRIRQYERMEVLPATANSLRYLALLEQLAVAGRSAAA